MPPTERLIQEIVLTGDDKLAARMQKLGLAEAKGLDQASKGADRFSKSLERLGAAAAKIRMEEFRKRLAEADKAGERFGTSLRNLGSRLAAIPGHASKAALALAGVTAGLGLIAKGSVDTASEIKDTADAFDISKTELQGWTGAAGQFGIKEEQFRKGLGKLVGLMDDQTKKTQESSKAMLDLSSAYARGDISSEEFVKQQSELIRKQNDATDALTRFGIKLDPKAGVGANLEIINEAFGKMDATTRAMATRELFGGRGMERFATFLGQAPEDLSKLRRQFESLAIPDATVDTLENIGDKTDEMIRRFSQVKAEMTAAFSPALLAAINKIGDAVTANKDKLVAFANDLSKSFQQVVDDIVAMAEGRDQDVQNKWLITLRDAISGIASAITNIIIPAFKGFAAAMEPVAKGINAVFGTELTGTAVAVSIAIGALTGVFTAFAAVITVVVTGIGALVAAFGAVPVALGALAIAFGIFVIAFNRWVTSLLPSWQQIWDGMKTAASTVIEWLSGAWQAIRDGAAATWQWIADSAKAAWDGIKAAGQSVFDWLTSAWDGVKQAAETAWNGVKRVVSDALNGLIDLVKKAIRWLEQLWDWAKKAGSALKEAVVGEAEGGAIGGMRGGGRVHGPGSSTSDSILARLSTGEFVVRAAAVRKYGAAFLDAINSMSFADGGLVGTPLPVPNLATAGAPQATRRVAVDLSIMGQQFNDLLAPEAVADKLVTFAVSRQARSAGRKPSWTS